MADNRSDLIRALSAACAPPAQETEASTMVTGSTEIDGHKYSRIIETADASDSVWLSMSFPESSVIKSLADALKNSGESIARSAGFDLEKKFNTAVAARSNEQISRIIDIAKIQLNKLRSTPAGTPQRSLIFLSVAEEIRKIEVC